MTGLPARARVHAAPAGEQGTGGQGLGTSLWAAFALMLVIEGMLPFLLPAVWRETFRRLTEMTDGQIRFVGLSSMLVGLLVLLLTQAG